MQNEIAAKKCKKDVALASYYTGTSDLVPFNPADIKPQVNPFCNVKIIPRDNENRGDGLVSDIKSEEKETKDVIKLQRNSLSAINREKLNWKVTIDNPKAIDINKQKEVKCEAVKREALEVLNKFELSANYKVQLDKMWRLVDDHTLINYQRFEIQARDIKTCKPTAWLNDNIMAAYFSLVTNVYI